MNANRPDFHPAPECVALSAGEVHLWRTTLGSPRTSDRDLLSPDEWIRAERFHFTRDCDRFVAARVFLRRILSRYLGCGPGEIRFRRGPNGKPEIDGAATLLRFNLSHSEDLMLLAVTQVREVGVDLEALRPNAPYEISDRYFAPEDAWLIRTLPAPAKHQRFYELWTRTEALLKASGAGFAHGNRVVHPERWSLLSLTPAEGFAASLAIESGPFALRCWTWPN
ncbi:MAG: 4'-phosphopantetheinyl transferase superfamily protein [Chthoniobacteraceae bacterium]